MANLLTTRVLGYSSGAPPKTCFTLVPGHPETHRQNSPPPYQVLPSAGQGRVRLILGSPEGLPYQGFMILARDVSTGEYVGEFTSIPPLTKHVECIEGLKVSELIITFLSQRLIIYLFIFSNLNWEPSTTHVMLQNCFISLFNY